MLRFKERKNITKMKDIAEKNAILKPFIDVTISAIKNYDRVYYFSHMKADEIKYNLKKIALKTSAVLCATIVTAMPVAATNGSMYIGTPYTATSSVSANEIKKEITEDGKAGMVIKGLPEEDSRYDITLDLGILENYYEISYVNASEDDIEKLKKIFTDDYSISVDNLEFTVFNISMTCDGNDVEDLEENIATVKFPLDEKLSHSTKDLRAICLKDDGSIEILDSKIYHNNYGEKYMTFTTNHFSIFALVNYLAPETEEAEVNENIATGAPSMDNTTCETTYSINANVFAFTKKKDEEE